MGGKRRSPYRLLCSPIIFLWRHDGNHHDGNHHDDDNIGIRMTMPAVDGETITQRQHSTINEHKLPLPRKKVPSLVYILPYVIGMAWTILHPLLSIVTGEPKCRGAYIDENGLDVHRYRIPGYPTSRLLLGSKNSTTPTSSSSLPMEDDDDDDGATDDGRMTKRTNHRGMCHALRKLRPSSEFVDCLTRATATTTTIPSNDDDNNRQQKQQQQQQQQRMIVSFDMVRIIPTLGPMKDMTEAIVLVVGGSHY